MAPVRRLWLVRHPRPAVPVGLCYGRTDVPVDDAHLQALLQSLPARLPAGAALYSSPLSRCLRLARGLQQAGFQPPVIDPRLQEMHFGDWEGRDWAQVPREQIDAWRDDLVGYTPPGGESVAALAARAMAFVADLPAPVGEAVLVTHAGVIQTLLQRLLEAPLEHLTRTKVDFGEVIGLHHDTTGWTRLPVNGPEA